MGEGGADPGRWAKGGSCRGSGSDQRRKLPTIPESVPVVNAEAVRTPEGCGRISRTEFTRRRRNLKAEWRQKAAAEIANTLAGNVGPQKINEPVK